eukprot:CAMPEP_0204875922 /NCGR_PEP_ID=MMETSP1348-20121228/47249_1 /ASSEMBLY_ACC=CAM_ASM_000700 /TAXON_ID=215587 /ORGANISM="Aplanochytrium stocchinoi, Strain GSBS06" /LENGTH=418 /DNA_ID=CAMNT_0052032601 /DNA_START=150 /DNA_END=1407 /DNA_ORIENTATION=+
MALVVLGSEYLLTQYKSVFHSWSGVFEFQTPQGLVNGFRRVVIDDLERARVVMENAADKLECIFNNSPLWQFYDGITFEAWIRENTVEEESRVILRNLVRGIIAQEASVVSALSIVLNFKGCFSGGVDDQFRMRGGGQGILLRMQQNARFKISLNCPVTSITRTYDGTYLVKRASGITRAKYVICTGASASLNYIQFKPQLDTFTAQLLQRLPMGASLKYFLVYDKPWWKESNHSGSVYVTKMPQHEKILFDEGEYNCMDHSQYAPGKGVMMCWIEGYLNLNFLGTLSAKEQELHVLEFLYKTYKDKRVYHPLYTVTDNWGDVPSIRGAYSIYLTPGTQSQPLLWNAYIGGKQALGERKTLPKLFFCGSDWNYGFGQGYMEGAVRHGQMVADEIVKRHKITLIPDVRDQNDIRFEQVA